MAYNMYNQRAQPHSFRGQYQGQPQQNGWSGNAGQQYENGYQQQQVYKNWDYSQHAGEHYGYQTGQGHYGRETYSEAGQSPSQGDGQYYDQQQHNQQYQYDPRYRSQGEAANGQADRRQDREERQAREKHRPQKMDLKGRSKSRERILPAKESPIVVAWDNPFPVFNTKKKDGKKKHSSLDKEMSMMNVDDQLQQRPQTSQSHRRGDESRSHTSQGHRRPEPQINRSGLPSPHPMSPTDRNPAMRKDSSRPMPTQRNFSDGQRPPNHRTASDQPVPSFEGEPAPRLQQSQRSMTMPDEAALRMGQKKLQKGQAARSNQQAPETRGGASQEPYTYVPAPISPVPVPAAVQQNGRAATIRNESARTTLISPEMPNFDAISPSASERTEDPLHVHTNSATPAYQKAAYQAPVGATSLPRNQSQPEFQQTETTQPDFAGFSFDLPADSNVAPHFNQQPFPTDYKQTPAQAYDPLSPRSNPPYQAQSHSRAEQHPPRSASRQGYQQPRSASTAERYDSPNMPQSQYRSASGALQYTDERENRSITRDPIYNYDQGSFGTQQGRPSEVAGRKNSRPSQDTQRPYQDQRQYPARIDTRQDAFDPMRQQQSQTPQSAHPTPSRQYHPGNPSNSINPDALPAHPVPVRPGLMEKNPSVASRPIIEGTKIPYQAPSANPGLSTTTLQEDKPAPITPYDLNLLLQTIKNNPNDLETTLNLAKKLVEAASVLSSEGGNADAKTTQKNRERYIFDSHKYLKKLVHRGYPEAMFYLAECHGQGLLGLQVDPKEAFNLYTSAAKAGHAQAAYRVAVCCEMGNEEGGGTRRDPLKAMHWYKKAASMGDTPAMYKLGIILLKGLLGQARNPREAKSWLQRAAEKADKDNPHALHELGLMHENPSPSDSIVKDEKYSLQLFTQAAELGYKFSQFRLGSAHEYGMLGCPIDPRQSIAWYTRAAAQGEHQSELALSGWYLTGSDGILQQSDTEAYLWARKAASSGLAKAEYAMGYFTEVGIGCSANQDEAKKWYWRAASQNFPQARQRLEDLKRGGGKMHKTKVSRSAFNQQNEGECSVM